MTIWNGQVVIFSFFVRSMPLSLRSSSLSPSVCLLLDVSPPFLATSFHSPGIDRTPSWEGLKQTRIGDLIWPFRWPSVMPFRCLRALFCLSLFSSLSYARSSILSLLLFVRRGYTLTFNNENARFVSHATGEQQIDANAVERWTPPWRI